MIYVAQKVNWAIPESLTMVAVNSSCYRKYLISGLSLKDQRIISCSASLIRLTSREKIQMIFFHLTNLPKPAVSIDLMPQINMRQTKR